jgi:hypothetical protein
MTSPVPLGLNIPAGKTPIILNALQVLTGVGTPYATNLSSSLRSSGSGVDLFTLIQLMIWVGMNIDLLPSQHIK